MSQRNPIRRQRRRLAARSRRGVVGVLSMMFMVLFGSLAVAMAVVSQGNLQTAQTQLRVNRAIGAADTGLAIARSRLAVVGRVFLLEKGEITPDYAEDLWTGSFSSSDGAVQSPSGAPMTSGVRDLLALSHAGYETTPIAPDYTAPADWLVTDAVILEKQGTQPVAAAQVTYAPIAGTTTVRAIVTGYAWDWTTSRWVSRTVQQSFEMDKRVDHAILGPSKIMIGKNVLINGPLGARFTGVENEDGHPLVIKSDFRGLSVALDNKINDLYAAIHAQDTNGDNRLATQHTIEGSGLSALNAEDYDGDGSPDGAFGDHAGDGAIDDFDLFLDHFDQDGDGRLILDPSLTAGTPNDGQSAEFDIDNDLALLLDSANPDRNGDGVVDAFDQVLGYRDGVIDKRDRYAKIRGGVAFKVDRSDWEAMDDGSGSPIGDYQKFVEGPIRPDAGDRPVQFSAGDDVIPSIDTSTFDTANSDLASAADGAPFSQQAGVPTPLYTLVTDSSGAVVGQQFNAAISTIVEPTPFGAPAAADYYERPVFQGITFKNVVIPRGLNALFIDCTFAGVTRVESFPVNTHSAWQFYGVQDSALNLKYPPRPADSPAQLDNDYFTSEIIKPAGFDIPRLEVGGTPYVNTKPLSNNIRFHNCLFVGSIVSDRPTNYTHIRNKLQFTGSTTFYKEHPENPGDPDLNPDSSDVDTIRKSSMMLPHYSVDIGTNNAPSSQDVNLQGLIIAGVLDVRGNTNVDGALLLTFEPKLTDPALQHFGQAAGNPADFNATLGYFGPTEGDEEGFNYESLIDLDGDGTLDIGWDADGDGFPDPGADPATSTAVPFNGFGRIKLEWDPDLVMPDGLIAPMRIDPIPFTYREGRVTETN